MYITETEDTEKLSRLYQNWTGKGYGYDFIPWNTHWFVAVEGGEYIAGTQLIIVDDPLFQQRWGLIENVYVLEKYQKQGIGRMMMDKVFESAFLWGCEFVKLTTRKDGGKALYRSMGMEEGSSFYAEKRDSCNFGIL